MKPGTIIRDGWGRYWRVRSVVYAPWHGVRLNAEGPCRSMHVGLAEFMQRGGCIVRRLP